MTFFKIFFAVPHLLIETKLFCVTKISYLQPFREIMGGQTKLQFSTKNDATGQKNDLFRIFFLLLHILTSRQNFFVLIKFSYLQPFREIMGGQRKALHRTTNERRRTTTNDDDEQRRTTTNEDKRRRTKNYMDDDNSPLGFFQNPRANKQLIDLI